MNTYTAEETKKRLQHGKYFLSALGTLGVALRAKSALRGDIADIIGATGSAIPALMPLVWSGKGSWNHAINESKKYKFYKTDKNINTLWFWGPGYGEFTNEIL